MPKQKDAKINLEEIEEMGEESGREEASDDFPYVPIPSKLNGEERKQWRSNLIPCGHKRAREIYELNGEEADVFAENWAMGYIANCEIFEREEMFEEGSNA